MRKKYRLRKGSPAWFISRYWKLALIVFGLSAIAAFAFSFEPKEPKVVSDLVITEDMVQVIKVPEELKEVATEAIPLVFVATKVEHKQPSTLFSRGSYTPRVAINKVYTEAEVKMVAALLYAEAPGEQVIEDWDPRLEANVILNRAEQWGKTIEQIVYSGNGSQFNGIRKKSFKEGFYTDREYDAAYAVLIKGERLFDVDIVYFSNLSTATDKKFINSIDWVYKQKSDNGHSFGRRKK